MEEKGPPACPQVIEICPGYTGGALPDVAAMAGEIQHQAGSATPLAVWRVVVGCVWGLHGTLMPTGRLATRRGSSASHPLVPKPNPFAQPLPMQRAAPCPPVRLPVMD